MYQVDDGILHYQEEDGKLIEPTHFLPIIPLVLVNGSSGIGTGWSTSIPSFHPLELIHYVRDYLSGENKKVKRPLVPWVKGFKGRMEHSETGFKTYGIVKRTSATVVEVTKRQHMPTCITAVYKTIFFTNSDNTTSS